MDKTATIASVTISSIRVKPRTGKARGRALLVIAASYSLKSVDLAVPVQLLVPLLAISRSPTLGSGCSGVATTVTHSPDRQGAGTSCACLGRQSVGGRWCCHPRTP